MEPQLRAGELYKYQEMMESEKVKYISFYEFKPEDLDKVILLFQKMQELRAKGDVNYPKAITPTYGYQGEPSGFALFEVDNPQQINNHYIHYHPLVKYKWVPITEAADFIVTYLKAKK